MKLKQFSEKKIKRRRALPSAFKAHLQCITMWLAVQNAVSWKKLVKGAGGASLKADTLGKEVIKCIVRSCFLHVTVKITCTDVYKL